MAKRKRSRKEISERAARRAENDPVVRRLRAHADSIWDELEAKGLAEKWGGRPTNAEERLQRLQELVAKGEAEREERRRAADSP
jgi:hypothetical protein